jgi:hypothetical protein
MSSPSRSRPFNRYRTLDVIGGVVEAGAEERVALYTGNDDRILLDLVPFMVMRAGKPVTLRLRGGLLGHWSVWVRSADCNSAFFDVANDFRRCIAGCHEVLRRPGLLEGIWCLDPDEGLSRGQKAEIDRVYAAHGDLADDGFVAANLARWLG